MANEYVLCSRTTKQGIMNNSTIYEFTFIDQDHDVYQSVIDDSYRNFTKWQHLTTGTIPYGIYSGIRRTTKTNRIGATVVNADFVPQLVCPLTEAQVDAYIDVVLGR